MEQTEEIDSNEIESYVRKVVEEVLRVEEEKLYMERARGIYDEIEVLIKDIVRQ